MKTFKRLDFRIQVTLISLSLAYGILFRNELFLYGYYITGGWQLLSCLVHFVFKQAYYSTAGRIAYLKCIMMLIALGLLLGIAYSPALIIYGFIMLAVPPFLAYWYADICRRETEMLEYRSLVQLK
jgi:hypothetical protein